MKRARMVMAPEPQSSSVLAATMPFADFIAVYNAVHGGYGIYGSINRAVKVEYALPKYAGRRVERNRAAYARAVEFLGPTRVRRVLTAISH